MSGELPSEQPIITLQYERLAVNGQALRANVLRGDGSDALKISPEDLESVLIPARRPILRVIEDYYERNQQNNPGLHIVRPSIWTTQLASTKQAEGRSNRVFTELGYRNGGVHTLRDELQPDFHEYWDAVRNAGFMPEVRLDATKPYAGPWLLLRKPTLDEVALHWFDFPSDAAASATQIKDDDMRIEAQNLRQQHLSGEAIVDRAPDERRSRLEVGLILSMAAIKATMGDQAAYARDIDDAFDFLDSDPTIDIGATRAVENATFEPGM